MTQIILTQDIYKLGTVGDLVSVKPGYARNYLIPQGYALRVNKQNLEFFEVRKAELQEVARKHKDAAVALSDKIDGKTFTYIAAASERAMLYGAVTPTVVADLLANDGIIIGKNTVQIAKPIKTLGLHTIRIALHNEVSASIILNIARNLDESYQNLKTDKNTPVANDDLDALNILNDPETSETSDNTTDADAV
jgi:large subunit ribosomal protein L9